MGGWDYRVGIIICVFFRNSGLSCLSALLLRLLYCTLSVHLACALSCWLAALALGFACACAAAAAAALSVRFRCAVCAWLVPMFCLIVYIYFKNLF